MPRRSRRRLAATPLRRVPWPVAADPDAVTATLTEEPRHREAAPAATSATALLPGSPVAPTVHVPGLRAVPPGPAPGPGPVPAPLPGPAPMPAPAPVPVPAAGPGPVSAAGPAPVSAAGPRGLAPPPTVPPPGGGVPVTPGPAGPPPRRAPIHRDRVPGTPVADRRPVWGPPQPVR
ncbi:hypothetical protein GCM10023204_21010 [Actinomycetospora succinea]